MADIEKIPTVNETVNALKDADFCASCELLGRFTESAHSFMINAAELMQPGTVNIFIYVFPLWFVWTLAQVLYQVKTVADLVRNSSYIIMIFLVIVHMGPEMVSGIFALSLELIGTMGQVAFLIDEPQQWARSNNFTSSGIINLVYTIEQSIEQIFVFTAAIVSNTAWYAKATIYLNTIIFIDLPFITTLFFAQIVMAVWRIIMISFFSPFIMFMFAFDWGRGVGHRAAKAVLSSIFIAIACSAAMSLTVYVMASLVETYIAMVNTSERVSFSEIWPVVFMLLTMAIMGIAFMIESTNIANSLAESTFGNAGAALITGAMTTISMFAAKHTVGKAAGMIMSGSGRLAGHGMGLAGKKMGGAAASQISKLSGGAAAVSGMSRAQEVGARLMEIARPPRP